MPTPRLPRTTAKIAQDCSLCARRIKPGKKLGKDFTTNEWVHVGCLFRLFGDERGGVTRR